MKLCWHKWHNVFKKKRFTFLDETLIENVWTGYRVCSKCKRVQQAFRDGIFTFYYVTLDEQRRRMFWNHVNIKNGLYILMLNQESQNE